MITYLILYFRFFAAISQEQKALSPLSGKEVAFFKIYASHTSYNVPKGVQFPGVVFTRGKS